MLLESAWFEPSTVRRTSRRHGLSSEASYRFERGADPGMVIPALDRCAALIAELSSGKVRGGVLDVHPRSIPGKEVRLRWARPSEVLGLEVSQAEVERILSGLGFQAAARDREGATFAVPSWRVDVSIEEDLVEEVIRTRGYDAIPETLPAYALLTPSETDESRALHRIREALEGGGLSEAVNFSFVSAKDLEPFRDPVATGDGSGRALGVTLKNPISADLSVMRTKLVPSLLKNLALNLRQRVEDVRLYEIARTYAPHPEPKDIVSLEPLKVSAVLLGRRHPVGWATGGEPTDFYDAKVLVEEVLAGLGIAGATFRPRARTGFTLAARRWSHFGRRTSGRWGRFTRGWQRPSICRGAFSPSSCTSTRSSRRASSCRDTGPSRACPRCCATSRWSSRTR